MNIIETQPRVIKQLTKTIKKGRVSHAFLFDGERGTPKMEVAKFYSKSLLCKNRKKYTPCMECEDCLRVDSRNHPNITYVEAEGLTIKKEQVKELQKNFSVTSLEENKRIYIMNNVEKLSTAAANSLLKFLEEPEDDVHAILLTDNMHQVINTIVSRCQIINFTKPNIAYIASQYVEKGYNEEKAILACLISDSNQDIEEVIESEEFIDLMDGLKQSIDVFINYGIDIICELPQLWHKKILNKNENVKAVQLLIYLFRDLLNYKLDLEIEYFKNSKDIIDKMSKGYEIENIVKNIETLFDTKKKLDSNVNHKLAIDQMFLRLKGCRR